MAPHFVTERERREAVRKTTQLASQAIFVDAQVVSEHMKATQRKSNGYELHEIDTGDIAMDPNTMLDFEQDLREQRKVLSSRVTFGRRFANAGKATSTQLDNPSFIAVDAPSSLDHLHLAQGAAKSLKVRAEKRLLSMIPGTVNRVTTSEVTAGALIRSRSEHIAREARSSSSPSSATKAEGILPKAGKVGVMPSFASDLDVARVDSSNVQATMEECRSIFVQLQSESQSYEELGHAISSATALARRRAREAIAAHEALLEGSTENTMRVDYEELRSVLHSFVCRARIDSHALVASIAGVLTPGLAKSGVIEEDMDAHGINAEEAPAAGPGLTEGAAAQRIQVAFKRSRLERNRSQGHVSNATENKGKDKGEEKITPKNPVGALPLLRSEFLELSNVIDIRELAKRELGERRKSPSPRKQETMPALPVGQGLDTLRFEDPGSDSSSDLLGFLLGAHGAYPNPHPTRVPQDLMARVKSDLEEEMRLYEEKVIQEEGGWESDSSSDSDTDSEMSEDEGEFTAFSGGRVGMGTGHHVGKTFAFEINAQRRGSVGFARLDAGLDNTTQTQGGTEVSTSTPIHAPASVPASAPIEVETQDYDDDSSEDEFWGHEEKVEEGAEEQKETPREERSETFLEKAAEFLGLSGSGGAPTEEKGTLPLPPPPPAHSKASPKAMEATFSLPTPKEVSAAARVAVPAQRSRGAKSLRREKFSVLRANEGHLGKPRTTKNYTNWLSEKIETLRATEMGSSRGTGASSARQRLTTTAAAATTTTARERSITPSMKAKKKKKKKKKKKMMMNKSLPAQRKAYRRQRDERQDFFTSNYGRLFFLPGC